ncbi:hypothetical protein T4E_1785 [Trichinella pseudospiralis]|uniref:Uncharacterized protein n=1 Tax=Trichinella pseudospiralis TaxID=6337 RepID=A0A0V0XGL1_TRIPS|nr:hypothetical protein T4E_1756 [Trichinella pseudospiralis]KRX87484.1 hypothetical protein T4E_1785 [Trichinella pseudospiralis]
MECGKILVDMALQKRAASFQQSFPYTVRKRLHQWGQRHLPSSHRQAKIKKPPLEDAYIVEEITTENKNKLHRVW